MILKLEDRPELSIGTEADKIYIDFAYMEDSSVDKTTSSELVANEETVKLDDSDLAFLRILYEELGGQTVGIGLRKSDDSPILRKRINSFFTSKGELKELMAEGNMKLSKTILVFDLPAGRCQDSGSCPFILPEPGADGNFCPGCYARKAEVMYPDVFEARNRNFELAMKNLNLLEKMIRLQLKKYQGKKHAVRIHSSGDFFNQEYTDMWARITKSFPSYFFYAYTKTDKRDSGAAAHMNDSTLELDTSRSGFDFSGFGDNFSIIPSYLKYKTIDKDGEVTEKLGYNYGGEDFIRDVASTYPRNNLNLGPDPYLIINDKGDAYPIIKDAKLEKQDMIKKESSSYNDYQIWFCPATNPSLRSKHLIKCGKDCEYCTSKKVKDKKVAFWAH